MNGSALLNLIRRRGGAITARELMRAERRRYPDSKTATAALEALVGSGAAVWWEVPPAPRGGWPTRVCVLRDVALSHTPPAAPPGRRLLVVNPEYGAVAVLRGRLDVDFVPRSGAVAVSVEVAGAPVELHVLDPRALVLDYANPRKVLYNPRHFANRMRPPYRAWMEANPGWCAGTPAAPAGGRE
jgi:hypothetical protein